MSITARTVMRLVLSFSLLVAFTTSAAAALCLQTEQHTPRLVTSSVVVVNPTDSAGGTEAMLMSTGQKGSPSAHACCHQQASTPDAVAPPQRAVPTELADVLPAAVVQLPVENGHPPPGLFDPALEKIDHLTPSLTELSISRT